MKWHNIRNMFDHKTVRFLDFTPTSRCNARCMMCGIWKSPPYELSQDQAEQVLQHFTKLDLMLVEGGEVSTWPHLRWFVLAYLTMHKGEMLILTNGSDSKFWDAFAWFVNMVSGKAFQRVRFVVSIDGTPEVHDKMRGVEGLYKKAVASIAALKQFGNKVTIQYTPFKINENDYEHVRNLGMSLGCDVIICYPSFHTRFKSALNMDRVNPKKLQDMYRDRTGRIDRWRRWKRLAFLDMANSREKMPCIAGKQFMAVDPQGWIKPCIMSDVIIGSVSNGGVELFESRKRTLRGIPGKCQYDADGNVCCDYLNMTSLGMYPHHLLVWRIKKYLGRYSR